MKSTVSKTLFLTNYLLLIFYMSWNINEKQTAINSGVPLLISSFMLIDITYISSCNIRESKVMNLFCGLLALDSWYMILSFEEGLPKQTILTILHPVICYLSIKFVLMFLFQGSGYNFKRITDIFLFITCVGSLIGIFISDRVFACLYGIHLLTGCMCFVFILIYHRKRIVFVLKSEWKYILFSAVFTVCFFYIYYFATLHVKNHITNFGVYLTMLLFVISVHGIVMKENSSYPLSTVFSKKQTAFIVFLFLTISGLITALTRGGYKNLFITVNMVFAFIYICNMILGRNLMQGKNRLIKESKYNEALRELKQEEALKSEFANFLHDDVLQDLLSIKNMAAKAHRPNIQDIIIETLDNLNKHIRKQMQDYHPAILNSLTIKENYQNLIEAVSQSFPERNIMVSFDCSDILFLVEPYNVLIYRLLKELLTNVYKHSDGNRAWVTLTQENGIIELCVSDDGTACTDSVLATDSTKHKGIATITEWVNNMEGSVHFLDNTPHGICVQITLPMKGDDSYQYFVS
ncbi:MAG: ATP-binding protein [Lachnospiraceae bacterium]|nr:ATP-binding protein [Lachnospiraceae bacterium]